MSCKDAKRRKIGGAKTGAQVALGLYRRFSVWPLDLSLNLRLSGFEGAETGLDSQRADLDLIGPIGAPAANPKFAGMLRQADRADHGDFPGRGITTRAALPWG
jgi:hypothetical protein